MSGRGGGEALEKGCCVYGLQQRSLLRTLFWASSFKVRLRQWKIRKSTSETKKSKDKHYNTCVLVWSRTYNLIPHPWLASSGFQEPGPEMCLRGARVPLPHPPPGSHTVCVSLTVSRAIPQARNRIGDRSYEAEQATTRDSRTHLFTNFSLASFKISFSAFRSPISWSCCKSARDVQWIDDGYWPVRIHVANFEKSS